MGSIKDIQARWRETQNHNKSLAGLQRSVRHNGDQSPCISGLRSVCWKTFLLSRTGGQPPNLVDSLRSGRQDYEQRTESFLKFIRHPEALSELAVDPLADDVNSPWDTARQDEIIRTEILQDVQRLPDEPIYHEDHIQTLILDVLFIYCKSYPSRGGYRQGMHELLAPIVYVLATDALDPSTAGAGDSVDASMLEVLNASCIEPDAYILFSKLMDNAQSFYEVNEVGKSPAGAATLTAQERASSIVERSKFIHEVCLAKVDPELANHLTRIEILPQIFLIRWIRLLFSREYPLEEFLVLWDTILAVDPTLDLIDLICVAMLIRIRWELLEADYSVCLQLLLRYPAPDKHHGPHTFVDDAIHLRDHMDATGGSTIIMKYTGRKPSTRKSTEGTRPTTPSFRSFNTLRKRSLGGARSPDRSPAGLLQQQRGMDAIFQNAAKGARGVFQKGEQLGINKAVRDAVGELKRGFNEARNLPKTPRDLLKEEGGATAIAAMEERNRQLAAMLDDTVTSLKTLSTTNLDDKAKSLEMIEIAAAKIQFVKIYLEDPAMEVPMLDLPVTDGIPVDPEAKLEEGTNGDAGKSPDIDVVRVASLDSTDQLPPEEGASNLADAIKAGDEVQPDLLHVASKPLVRPSAPIPTRSSLAQSSFSWMLEPDQSAPAQPPTASRSPPANSHKKRPNNASRDRNAFLFGESPNDTEGRDPMMDENLFGMEPLQKVKPDDV